ncbi:MAG: alpha/beta hydrolase [Clostridia bacterium]|nr:alpha/beta hydrolase [Clostridia bacterium]
MMKLWEKGTPLYNEEYGQPETELKFMPADTSEPAGCVIVCAGGGYGGRAWHEAEPYAKMFNAAGIHAAVLDYRVAPYCYPAQLYDINRAVRYVRYHAEEWNVKPDKIAVCGSSAGGHLAVMGAEHYDYGRDDGDEIDAVSCRPDAAILCYTVSTFGDFTHKGTRTNLTHDDPELVEKLSGEKNVPDDCPPMFIWHTVEDAGVPVENALLMGMALKAKNIPYEMHLFPEGWHGVGLAEDTFPHTAQWAPLCQRWLKHIGF